MDYDGMDENDRSNLEFLLNSSPETLQDWFQEIDEEDLDYALELLKMLQLRIIDICAEKDLSKTKEILSKYTLT